MRSVLFVVCLTAVLSWATPASAQFSSRVPSNRAVGETYHVELFGGFWSPTPEITISSESLGIAGDDIDFTTDLGIEKDRFGEFRVVGRPALKHKFRLAYIPIRYESSKVVERTFVFNGQEYRVGVTVETELEWKAWRFGYEYDFVYKDRGFVGFVVDLKYTNVSASLSSPIIGLEFSQARVGIPTIGGIGRAYLAKNAAITFEMTGMKLPDSVDRNRNGQYLDWDLYGTVNFTDHGGVQIGYRSISIDYLVDEDRGDLKLKGLYFAGIARF